MDLHRLLNHLPSDLPEYRRYRSSVGNLIDAHLAIEDVLNPKATAIVRAALTNLAPLKAGSRPLIDGHVLATTTELPSGRRLGRLKEWLNRIQIEQELANSDEVLAILDVLDWTSTDPELWPDTGWP